MMNKKITKKESTGKKNTSKSNKQNIIVSKQECKPHFNAWSLSIYIYWFIILFFISATFYILGRSHGLLNPMNNNIEMTEEALKETNDYFVSGKQNFINGKLDDAISDFTVVINSENPPAEVFVMRGEAYMNTGDYNNAMSDFDSAIKYDSNSASAYYDRAILKTRLEDFSGALSDINSALASRTMNSDDKLQLREIYAKRGQLNLWLKNWEGAVADYTNSLSRPEGIVNPSVYSERAEAYTALNKYNDAINDYSAAVRVVSEQIQGTNNSEEIEDLSRKAMGYFEKSAALNVRIGNLAAAKKDLESAYTISVGLNDDDTSTKIRNLITGLK